jgi:hypothetical protein
MGVEIPMRIPMTRRLQTPGVNIARIQGNQREIIEG